MSGGTKQQFKQFSITSAEDACLVLGMLISGMTVNLEKYKEYASEAESLLESTQEEYVPAKEYDDVNDKLLYIITEQEDTNIPRLISYSVDADLIGK